MVTTTFFLCGTSYILFVCFAIITLLFGLLGSYYFVERIHKETVADNRYLYSKARFVSRLIRKAFYQDNKYITLVALILVGAPLWNIRDSVAKMYSRVMLPSTPWLVFDTVGIHFPQKPNFIFWQNIQKIEFHPRRLGRRYKSPRIYIYHDDQVTTIDEFLNESLSEVFACLESAATQCWEKQGMKIEH